MIYSIQILQYFFYLLLCLVPKGYEMLLQPIIGFKNANNNSANPNSKQHFQNSACNILSFTSTSAGQPLKKLRNVPCPYFDVITISNPKVARICKDLQRCTTVKEVVRYLKKYKNNLQKTERAIFERFEEAANSNPDMELQDLLKEWYNSALIKLKLEEFQVLNSIDRISLKLSPQTAFAIGKKITKCKQIIFDNNPRNTFKRKTLLSSLYEVETKPEEKRSFRTLLDKANHLPTSTTSENAFIVKYANRPHYEIAKRLVIASAATIEHVKPESKGGKNELSNFMLASANANHARQNMPLTKFIKMFPQIPQNCQKYIDFIIEKINHGALSGNETYPYKIKETLSQESHKKIKLDLSKYKYTEEQAQALENQRNCETTSN